MFALSPPTHTPRHTHEDNRCPDRGLPILRGTPEYGPVAEIWKLRQSSGPTGLLSTFHVLAPPRPMHNAQRTRTDTESHTQTQFIHTSTTLSHILARACFPSHTRMHTHAHVHAYMHTRNLPLQTHTHTHTRALARVHTHIHTHTCTPKSRAYEQKRVYSHTCTDACTGTHTRKRTHTCTRTHTTHTCTQRHMRACTTQSCVCALTHIYSLQTKGQGESA